MRERRTTLQARPGSNPPPLSRLFILLFGSRTWLDCCYTFSTHTHTHARTHSRMYNTSHRHICILYIYINRMLQLVNEPERALSPQGWPASVSSSRASTASATPNVQLVGPTVTCRLFTKPAKPVSKQASSVAIK